MTKSNEDSLTVERNEDGVTESVNGHFKTEGGTIRFEGVKRNKDIVGPAPKVVFDNPKPEPKVESICAPKIVFRNPA